MRQTYSFRMPEFELPTVDPTRCPAEALILPEEWDLSFEGFHPEAFAVLERLRTQPHIEQYRKQKAGIRTYLKEPFKRYRDDLVVNWVLPNRLDFETERNVFSRLLKNDFGAGGCHHHLWMSFYRPGTRRLADWQLTHSINPDGFVAGLYVGGYATEPLTQALSQIAAAPERFLDLINLLLGNSGWQFSYAYATGKEKVRRRYSEQLDVLPEEISRADEIWIRHTFERAQVLEWQGRLVPHALEAILSVWPIYQFWARPSVESSAQR